MAPPESQRLFTETSFCKRPEHETVQVDPSTQPCYGKTWCYLPASALKIPGRQILLDGNEKAPQRAPCVGLGRGASERGRKLGRLLPASSHRHGLLSLLSSGAVQQKSESCPRSRGESPRRLFRAQEQTLRGLRSWGSQSMATCTGSTLKKGACLGFVPLLLGWLQLQPALLRAV